MFFVHVLRSCSSFSPSVRGPDLRPIYTPVIFFVYMFPAVQRTNAGESLLQCLLRYLLQCRYRRYLLQLTDLSYSSSLQSVFRTKKNASTQKQEVKIMAEAVSVEKLRVLVHRAIGDTNFANRIFTEPDRIAQENALSKEEKLIISKMNRELFTTARQDAQMQAKRYSSGELSGKELAGVVGGAGVQSYETATAANMIIGRSILELSGTTYL